MLSLAIANVVLSCSCLALLTITAISKNCEFGQKSRATKKKGNKAFSNVTEVVLVPAISLFKMSTCHFALKRITGCFLKLCKSRKFVLNSTESCQTRFLQLPGAGLNNNKQTNIWLATKVLRLHLRLSDSSTKRAVNGNRKLRQQKHFK